jgi:long-chain acyl-CoA synthetase
MSAQIPEPWLQSYPAGVSTVDPDQFSSLKHMLEDAFERYADLPAFSCMGTTLTFAEVDQQSRYFAAYLQDSAGLAKGDRVAIMLPNILQYPIAAFGALRAGLVVVNVNPLYTPRELEHQLKDSGATALVVLENFASTYAKIAANVSVKTVITTGLGDLLTPPRRLLTNFVVRHVKRMVPAFDIPSRVSFRRTLTEGKWHVYENRAVESDDLAFLQYTGGTTGVSKGAMLTHRNMVANVLQTVVWLDGHVNRGEGIVITPLPLYHVFSLTSNLLSFIHFGGHDVLIPNPRDIGAFIKAIRKYRFTNITAVNTLFAALLNHEDFAKVDCSRLILAVGGGMAVQRAVAERWQQATGNVITQGYGLTEASPVVTTNPVGSPFTGAVGLAVPSTQITIRDDDGVVLPVGEIGEICVRGPQVMKGYWNKDEETANVMLEDWLKTGDIGRLDEQGFLFIEDRKKDMIIVSGFKVFPNEVEDVLAHHPGVLEVAAVGIPDERAGEAVKIFVVRKDPALTEADLVAFARERLTGYKRPHHVEFREDLPKSSVGKILRRELR